MDARRRLVKASEALFRRLHGVGPERALVHAFHGSRGMTIATPWLGVRLDAGRPGVRPETWAPSRPALAAAPPAMVRDVARILDRELRGVSQAPPPATGAEMEDQDGPFVLAAGVPVDAGVWRAFAGIFLAGTVEETAHAAGGNVVVTFPFGRGYVMGRRLR